MEHLRVKSIELKNDKMFSVHTFVDNVKVVNIMIYTTINCNVIQIKKILKIILLRNDE